MLIAPLPTAAEAAADRAREFEREHPERETLLLAAAGAAKVLGARHSTTLAFAQAATTMAKVDLGCGSGLTVTGQSAFPVMTVTSVRVRTPYI